MAHGGGDLWSVREAGEYLGVSRATVYRLAARGDLVLVHVGARVSVLAASVLAFRDRAVSAATPPHGLPLGGQVWAPGTIGALEAGDGLQEPQQDPPGPEDRG
jgi:excisionase family DNA binding protein